MLTKSSHETYNINGAFCNSTNLDSSIPQMANKLTLTVDELAQQLNVSRATAYNLTRKKEFYPSIKVGHRTIISVQALRRWLDDQTEG